jgi:hypothetical protein
LTLVSKPTGQQYDRKRGEGTWDSFLKQHSALLWQYDVFSKRIITLQGSLYPGFIHVESRLAVPSPATFHPNEAWLVSQAQPAPEAEK